MTDIYAERFSRVLDHIDRHLDRPLPIDELCRLACFSRFHFQRQFSAYVGMSVTRYVQQMRLRRASYQLVFSQNRRIIEIALEAGFENPESFSRAFKRSFEQTPKAFRERPAWEPWKRTMPQPQRMREITMPVEIVECEEIRIAVLEHQGSPDLLFDSVTQFIDWRKSSGRSPVVTRRTFGMVYSDPEQTPPEAFRFDICGEVQAPVPPNPQGVINKSIPAGRFARLRHLGSTDRIGESANILYREWLPSSGEELKDFPLLFHYIKRIPEVAEHEQVTDIYLPLK
jgi:AraC family transcriptional regulator